MDGYAVLIIDDERDMRQLVGSILKRAGAEVYEAATGEEGLQELYQHRPDLVILDIRLPGADGLEICHRIRQLSTVPIIMLTALSGNEQLVTALDAGADDYIAKPFESEVLVAKARAAIRRCEIQEATLALAPYDDGYLTIDLAARRVEVSGQLVQLTPKEFDLLAYLFRHANYVRTYDQILSNIWGASYQQNPEYVHSFIWQLRHKLEEDPKNPVYLISEHTIGYRFESQLISNRRLA